MPEIVYRTIDKSAWGSGPWQDEPDKVEWRDEATGLPCIARRSWGSGSWCGYVGVAPGTLFHGQDYSVCDLKGPHGGFTFAGPCNEDDPKETAICHTPSPGEPDDIWWLGFDCAHAFDAMPAVRGLRDARAVYRTLDCVKAECAKTAAELVAAERARPSAESG